jgi:very-short-patch-repair endonuclease
VTVVAGEAGRRRAGIHVHRAAFLDRRDIRLHQGIPITAPARVLLDIAPNLTDRELERAFDEALVRRRTSRREVREMLSRYPKRTGCGPVRELVEGDRWTTRTRSEAEELFLELTRKGGLPHPEINVRLGRYEVDFLWRQQRVVVEIDGYAYHSSRAALERDHRRDAELQATGYLVIRISWRELTREPEAVLVRIALALARRSADR